MKNEPIRYKEHYTLYPDMPYVDKVVDVEHGGTGADNETGAVDNFEGVSIYDIDMPGGPVSLNSLRKIPLEKFPVDLVVRCTGGVKLNGVAPLEEKETAVFHITNFNSFIDYKLEQYIGVSEMDDEEVYLTPIVGVKHAGFYINGQLFVFDVKTSYLETPRIISPDDGSADLDPNITFKSSPFVQLYNKEVYMFHTHSDWEIALDKDFKDVVIRNTASSTDLTSWNIPDLAVSTTYYIRVRYMSNTGEYSLWSEPIKVTTDEKRIVPFTYDGSVRYDGSEMYRGFRYVYS